MTRLRKKFLKVLNNSGSEVAFFCSVPFHFFVFKDIIKYLPQAEFLLGCRYLDDTETSWQKRIGKMEHLCRSAERKIRIIPFKGARQQFFSRYKVIVSATGIILSNPLPPEMKLIRVQYGPGKDLQDFGVWNRKFDLILIHGPYSYNHLKIFAPCKIVGYPKFDDWFLDKVGVGDLSKKTKINPAKKNVLYLPTHGQLSSWQYFWPSIKKLTCSFNILIKPHPETIYHDLRLLKKISKQKIHIFDDTEDLLKLLFASDIVLCDSGGAIFDALLADKPIVILSSKNPQRFREKPSLKNDFQIYVTHERSIDEIIKQPGEQFCEIIDSPKHLMNAIRRAPKIYKKNLQRRKLLKKKLFSFCDGYDGKRAAKAIVQLKNSNKPEPRWLNLAIDAALLRYEARAKYWGNTAKRTARRYKRLIKKIHLMRKFNST